MGNKKLCNWNRGNEIGEYCASQNFIRWIKMITPFQCSIDCIKHPRAPFSGFTVFEKIYKKADSCIRRYFNGNNNVLNCNKGKTLKFLLLMHYTFLYLFLKYGGKRRRPMWRLRNYGIRVTNHDSTCIIVRRLSTACGRRYAIGMQGLLVL